jgi:CheY-like chemotaxis protein
MKQNPEHPSATAEANHSRTASDKAVVCKELLGLSAVTLEALAQHWERRAGGRIMRDKGSDFAQGLRVAYLQCADEVRAKLVLSPMEDPEMDWIDAMRRDREENPHSEVNVLLAQLECQARCISQYRKECAEKDRQRSRAEANVATLSSALRLATNTVECASLDALGQSLPWYRAAKTALEAVSPNAGTER